MKNLLLICISISLLTANLFAQSELPKKIEQKLTTYSKTNTPEKVYIQTDKPMYNVGEDIWYTAYLVNGITHQQSQKSKVIYAELLNPQDSIIAKKTLYVESISVAGDFKIEEDWQAGNYTLRGYTNYMRNNSVNTFFQKEIPIFKIAKSDDKEILETPKSNSQNITSSTTTDNISFYPEGGYLIEGLSSKIAFEIKGGTDNFTGSLIDQDENIIAEVKTIERGMGMFTLIPEAGKEYTLKGEINGKTALSKLPNPLQKGYTLSITNTRRGAILSMNSNTQNGLQSTYMTAHQRGVLLFDHFETRNTNTNTIKLPLNSLSNGVISFTLFDNNGHPVAERVAYINNAKNNVHLAINSDKEVYNSKEKVHLNLELTNSQGLKEYSFMSMAVRNMEATPYYSKSGNIKSYLLLNSDLRGEIKNPGYFFEKENDPKRNFILDLVMMTNGWKRFTWQELLTNEEQKQTYKAEEGLYVSGTTYDLKKKEKPIEAVVRLSFMGQFMAQTPEQPTDKNGRFEFGPDVYPGSISAIVESRKESFLDLSKRSKSVYIDLDKKIESPIFDKKSNIVIPEKIKQLQEVNFVKVNQYIQQIKFDLDKKIEALEAVELEHKRLTKLEKRQKQMKSRSGYGQPDNFNNRIDVENLDYVPSDIFQILESNPVISYDGENFIWKRDRSAALIYFGGREIDANQLYGISPEEVSFIDILTGTAKNFITNTSKAIIALYPSGKKKNIIKDKSIEREPGIVNFVNEGFYLARKFYAPKHASEFEDIETNSIRTTLHWAPMLVTTDKASTPVSFFTNNITTDYIIEVEGISLSGKPFHATKVITVK